MQELAVAPVIACAFYLHSLAQSILGLCILEFGAGAPVHMTKA